MRRRTEEQEAKGEPEQLDLFADFNGLPNAAAKTEFYQHDSNWSNRMILGDSLQVMASLAEREGLRGKVQCIYFDPPYGIKFNSNFQWSTTSRDVKDGKADHITREPEQVKAFRDTWRTGFIPTSPIYATDSPLHESCSQTVGIYFRPDRRRECPSSSHSYSMKCLARTNRACGDHARKKSNRGEQRAYLDHGTTSCGMQRSTR